MKRIIIIISLVAAASPLLSRDFTKTEEIINSILEVKQGAADNLKQPEKEKKVEDPPLVAGKDKSSPGIPSPDEVLLKTGIQFFNNGLFQRSINKFSELNKNYPSSPFIHTALVWKGRARIKLYNYKMAIDDFSAVPSDSGEYPASQYYTAESHSLMGDHLMAIEFYQKVSTQFPGHDLADNALLRTARLYLNRGSGSQSLESTIRLIKLYPDRETIDDAYYLLGRIFEMDSTLKDMETARRVYKLFLKKASSGEIWFARSPLRDRVRKDLKHIEKNHFMLEN